MYLGTVQEFPMNEVTPFSLQANWFQNIMLWPNCEAENFKETIKA